MGDDDSDLPQNYLLKVHRNGRTHYIFCDLVASFNYSGDPSKDSGEALVNRNALDILIDARARLPGELAEIAVALPEPGNALAMWTRKQSYPRN